MAVQIQIRRDTAANWTANDPTLASGEIGFETDTRKLKIGDGATAWTALGYYTTASGYFGYVKVSDVKAQNTHGGTFTLGAWRTRDLNTEDSDTNNDCSLAANQITLTAGTYECHITVPSYYVNRHQAILYNVTGAATVLIGTSEFNPAQAAAQAATRSIISGRFTIAGSQALEVHHQCQTTKADSGLGLACNFTSEIYTVAEFWRVS